MLLLQNVVIMEQKATKYGKNFFTAGISLVIQSKQKFTKMVILFQLHTG